MVPMNRQKGDNLPVSVFSGREDGTFPTGTTRYEKRGIALMVPEWDADACIQCNQCSLVCPHGVFRPRLLTKKELEQVPEGIREKARPAKGYTDTLFYMGFSPMDCTGCGNCIHICPAKEKLLRW